MVQVDGKILNNLCCLIPASLGITAIYWPPPLIFTPAILNRAAPFFFTAKLF